MVNLIVRRLATSIPMLFAVSGLTFFLIFASPGNYVQVLRNAMAGRVSDAQLDALAERLGVTEKSKWHDTWLRWCTNLVTRGDLGVSFATGRPVTRELGDAMLATFLLGTASTALAWFLAIPLGVVAALQRGKFLDKAASGAAFVGLSLPPVFLALVALIIADSSGLFPPGGMSSVGSEAWPWWRRWLDIGHHLVLPMLVLAVGAVALYTRQMRSSLLETLEADYVRTAMAKGTSRFRAIAVHAMRNAINPLITLLGFALGDILSGAFLVEVVLNWPGLGRKTMEALSSKDMYLVAASVILGSAMLMLGNLVADVLLSLNDPRIKQEG